MVSPDTIVVKTKAPLDDSFADIGLQVDKNDFIKMDNVVEERSALFASSYAKILEQFKKGSAPVKKGRKAAALQSPGAAPLLADMAGDRHA